MSAGNSKSVVTVPFADMGPVRGIDSFGSYFVKIISRPYNSIFLYLHIISISMP